MCSTNFALDAARVGCAGPIPPRLLDGRNVSDVTPDRYFGNHDVGVAIEKFGGTHLSGE